jgi:UDP-N-acetylglucosamine 3-dehydrogenase
MSGCRVALVGAGSMAANHARVIAGSRRASLAVVVDRDGDRAERLAHPIGATATTDLAQAFECDAAVVATATSAHAQASLALIDGGLPVLIEKPLASTLNESRQIIAAAGCRDVALMCGLVERFNPALAPLRDYAPNARTRICTFRTGPAPLVVHSSVVDDVLLHDLDLVLMLTDGDPVVEVVAHAEDWKGEWPETATCRLTFASGMTASLFASRAAATRRREFTIEEEGKRARHVDLLQARGNALHAQFDRFVDLVEHSTFSEREAERLSVLPSHELAHRVATYIAEVALPSCAS